MITITLSTTIKNTSLQVGDMAYSVPVGAQANTAGQITASNDPILIGNIVEVGQNSIKVNNSSTPAASDFIMFAKNNVVNNSGLKGYYANVKMSNSSADKIELFAINSEVVESSK